MSVAQRAIDRVAVLIRITPELANKWLSVAEPNRPVSGQAVSRYARDMDADRWEVNGETVKFSGEMGVGLIDGRHRLTACVQSGKSFSSYVVTGISEYREVDIGRRRSLADAAHIFGKNIDVPFGLALDGAVNLILKYACKSRASVNAVNANIMTHSGKLDFILGNQILASVVPASREYFIQRNPLRPSIAMSILWLAAFADRDLQDVHSFLRGVRDGVELPEGSPALAYRNFLTNSLSRKRTIPSGEAFRAAVSSVSNHLAGKYVKLFRVPDVVEFPGAEPAAVLAALGIGN